MRDADEIEKRTHEAGVKLVKAEDRLHIVQLEMEELEDVKVELHT